MTAAAQPRHTFAPVQAARRVPRLPASRPPFKGRTMSISSDSRL